MILDYLTRLEQGIPVGFGISFDRIDLASFAAAADVCDQEIPKKDGGIEKRWRTWGSYELTEECKAVLSDLLDACCGRLIQGPDGRLGLTVAADRYRALAEDPYTVPAGIPASSVALNDDQILEYDFSTGKAAIERINEVRAIYVSRGLGMGRDRGRHPGGCGRPGAQRCGEQPDQTALRAVRGAGAAHRPVHAAARRPEAVRPDPDDAGWPRRLGRALDHR